MASLFRPVTRPIAYQWALLSLGLLCFAAFFAYRSYVTYTDTKAYESERLLHQTRLIDHAVSNDITAVANALRDIRALFPDWNHHPNRPAPAIETLKRIERSLLGVRTLIILDANGDLFATNRDEIPKINFRERDYFKNPLRTPDEDILFLSPPFVGSLGVYIINISIGIFDADRRFQGVVAASLDVEHLNRLLDSVRYDGGIRVLLSHGSGKLFSMRPARKEAPGFNQLVPGSFFSRHVESGKLETVLEGVSAITKEKRIVASRTISPPNLIMSHPLVIAVSHDLGAILSRWRKDTLQYGLTLGALMAAVYATFYAYQRTQRKFAKDRIDLLNESNRSKERLLAVFDNHQDGFVVCDADDRVIAMNLAYLKINPLAKDAVAERLTFEDIIRLGAPKVVEARGRIDAYVRQRMIDHRAARATPTIRQIGNHWFMVRDIRTPGGEVISVLTDVTELKNTQDTLQMSERALAEKTERLILADRAKNRFLATMSHELRTPLNVILGLAQLLEKSPDTLSPQKRRDFIGDILASGRHLLSLINDLLDIIQIQSGKRKLVYSTISVAEAWQSPLDSVSFQAADKKLRLETHIPETSVRLNTDKDALRQCLQNVLANAVKFTPPGGTVTCRTEFADGHALFIIEDTGVGIAPDDLARLGQPFEQVGNPYKAETEGTGLGLAITSKLAKMMGGKLEVSSELGKGTKVTLELPLDRDASASA